MLNNFHSAVKKRCENHATPSVTNDKRPNLMIPIDNCEFFFIQLYVGNRLFYSSNDENFSIRSALYYNSQTKIHVTPDCNRK